MKIRIMVVDQKDILIDADGAVLHLADTDSSHVLIIIDGADQYLCVGVRVAGRRRNVFDDGLKKRFHVRAVFAQFQHGDTGLGRSIDERAVKLFVVGVQFKEQFQDLVHHFLRTGVRAVDLIDADDDREAELQRLFQNELGLWHRTFEGVHHQDDAVHHFEDTFHLATEVGMTGSIYNVDLDAVIVHGGIFGENGDTSLPLNIVGIHDTFADILILTEGSALF